MYYVTTTFDEDVIGFVNFCETMSNDINDDDYNFVTDIA